MPLTGAERPEPPVDAADGIDMIFESATGVLLSVNDAASNRCDAMRCDVMRVSDQEGMSEKSSGS